ncbi:hypothetical protein K469DRAFT_658746 [Zopfia rhizophila CBS 207.26]|uniref:Zinc finger PHD-type domain-containing protein n=1 Tax=Zopfia rhizophila CBS 207.26 TaxID=1314779 RepID=A0A6A6EGK4_9PEZI|nr:hypothetical protein K469DRAFT_658746 [Zopfia rhizophila CBS 207.26]
MVSRKRARDEMEAEEPPQEPSTLEKLRNMWQFANLMQYINLFGDAVKIDKDFDIEELENECLKPQPSEKLAQIGLALLKNVSSHKGLTPEIFDEYTRRQFVAKAPDRNPFGTDETPNKFNDFDVFTKIIVLQQLSIWTLNNPNSIRERLGAPDFEQALWRMEPTGWDSDERALFVLDDNRLYRRTDPPPPPPPPKAKSKAKSKKSRGTRSSKRMKASTPEPDDPIEDQDESVLKSTEETPDDGLGGMKWECLCISLDDYQEYMSSIRKSRDPNEKELYRRLEAEVLPVIQSAAEEQLRKEARKMKELETMQKLATAKRSSRISAKMERQREAEEAAEAERKRQADLAMARAEQEKQHKMEEARESRMMTREQRLKDREVKRILHEEEIKKLKEDSENIDINDGRISERQLKAEMKRRQEELQKLNEEDEWVFDCEVCGLYGENLDDGSHSIACEKCNVWQHSKCHNITVAQAERDDFHFVCKTCTRKEEDAKMPKLPPLKFRLTSASPKPINALKTNGTIPAAAPRRLEAVRIPPQRPIASNPSQPAQVSQPLMNGPSLSPRGQALGPPGVHRSEVSDGSPLKHPNGSSPPVVPRPYSSGQPGTLPTANGFPTSSPPQYQSPRVPSPYNNYHLPYPQANGSPYGAPGSFMPTHNPPYGTNFSRPASSTGAGAPYQSPVKHSPAPSPRPTNGVPNAYTFTNSPHSSFPPSSIQHPSFSPTKHSSPPPPLSQLSSPAPVPPRVAPSPSQMSTQVLPLPIPAPEKHDGVRPISSHSMSETPILPPIKSLSPSAKPQILSPPTKKPSPAPERLQFTPVGGNGVGGTQ